ncbi:hypothetical protein [Sulfurimonas sp. NW9]|uniref:hypothetical protein n=1 Tax=Sulfurimonas sp. NW9 TaxID=2922728 RepID=UPI003DAA4626
MTIDNECVGCIINQSVKVADAIGADKTLKNRLRTTVESMSKDFSFSKTPPEIAADVYEKMSELQIKKICMMRSKNSLRKKLCPLFRF